MKQANLFLTVLVAMMLSGSSFTSRDTADNLNNLVVDLILAKKVSLYTMHGEKTKSISFDEAHKNLRIEVEKNIPNDPNLLKRNGKIYLGNDAILLQKKVTQNITYLSVKVKGNYWPDGSNYLVALIKMSDLLKVVDKKHYEELEKIN